MKSSTFQPYRQLPPILFQFVQMLSLGIYQAFFLITFLTFEPDLFDQRMALYLKGVWILLVIGLGVGMGMTLHLLKEKQSGAPGMMLLIFTSNFPQPLARNKPHASSYAYKSPFHYF